jgi:hypothetical protein
MSHETPTKKPKPARAKATARTGGFFKKHPLFGRRAQRFSSFSPKGGRGKFVIRYPLLFASRSFFRSGRITPAARERHFLRRPRCPYTQGRSATLHPAGRRFFGRLEPECHVHVPAPCYARSLTRELCGSSYFYPAAGDPCPLDTRWGRFPLRPFGRAFDRPCPLLRLEYDWS